MPIFNLLILPVLGGYFLITKCEQFKYAQQRVERQRLVFDSVIKGFYLFVVTWIFTSLFTYYFPSWVAIIRHFYPIQAAYLGTSVGAFLLAVAYTFVANRWIHKDDAISRAIKSIGNELELLLEGSYRNAGYIQITLKNDKSYVGWVKSLPIPHYSDFILLLPVYSGYRHKETRELIFTTHYLNVYASYIREGAVRSIEHITDLVIHVDEIASANRFDDEMYKRFNPSLLPADMP